MDSNFFLLFIVVRGEEPQDDVKQEKYVNDVVEDLLSSTRICESHIIGTRDGRVAHKEGDDDIPNINFNKPISRDDQVVIPGSLLFDLVVVVNGVGSELRPLDALVEHFEVEVLVFVVFKKFVVFDSENDLVFLLNFAWISGDFFISRVSGVTVS